MNSYLEKTHKTPFWSDVWRQLITLITPLLIIYLISGCASRSSWQQYESREFGIELKKPTNWDVTVYERSGTIVLETEERIRNDGSARIEIHGNACIPVSPWFENSYEQIELNIDRIGILYDLDSVSIIQEPTKIEEGENEIIKAIISIPTMAFQQSDDRNQTGIQETNLSQIIEMFAIRNKDYFTIAYIYLGSSEELNAEAEEIVNSIQLICSTGP